MKRYGFASLVLSLLCLVAAPVGLSLTIPQACAADQKQTARPQIGEPVQQAGELLKQKKYKEALEKLRAADAVPDKTPYETYVIEGTRAAIALNAGDDATAEKALEAVLATGILAPQEALTRIGALVQINYRLKNYPQVTSFANRYYRDGGTDPEPRLLLPQAYYLQNDFANAAKTVRQILDADTKAAISVGVGGRYLDERDVERHRPAFKQTFNLAEINRGVIGAAAVDGFANIGPDEHGVVAEMARHLRRHVGGAAHGHHVNDFYIEKIGRPPHQRLNQRLRLGTSGLNVDAHAGLHAPQRIVRRLQPLFVFRLP